jgi:hypothetical protein
MDFVASSDHPIPFLLFSCLLVFGALVSFCFVYPQLFATRITCFKQISASQLSSLARLLTDNSSPCLPPLASLACHSSHLFFFKFLVCISENDSKDDRDTESSSSSSSSSSSCNSSANLRISDTRKAKESPNWSVPLDMLARHLGGWGGVAEGEVEGG